jgi:hypothetical protein
MRRKAILYAYPTSLAADRYNNGEACWLVDDNSGLPPVMFEEREKEAAFRFFRAIKLPVDRLQSFCGCGNTLIRHEQTEECTHETY